LSIPANIYLSIFNNGNGNAVSCMIKLQSKVSVEWWPHCRVRYGFISSFSIGPKWLSNNVFYSTFL